MGNKEMLSGTYKVFIRDLPNAVVKKNAECLQGNVYWFEHGWVIDEGMYKGEVAMLPRDKSYPVDAPIWIASGDLEYVS